MHKSLYLLLFFVMGFKSHSSAQSASNPNVIPSGVHKYYIYISGVNTRTDAVNLEKMIGEKQTVKYFKLNRFPQRYFLLISDIEIGSSQFASWMNGLHYKIEIYGEGEKYLGMCNLRYRKNKITTN